MPANSLILIATGSDQLNSMPSANGRPNRRFAERGLSRDEILDRLSTLRAGDTVWNDPQNLKAAYFAGDDVLQVSWDAYTAYKSDNMLYGKLLFPSLLKMSEEVVAKALEMLNACETGYGTFTSGGTESIILAVHAAREWARVERSVSGKPEIIVPQTCHAAFTKAADLLGLTAIRVPVDDEFRADPNQISEAVSDNTIMIVGSAPAYPIGSVDPIDALASIARQSNLWLHVDACVGGFFLPFATNIDPSIPRFDFSVSGVKSISLDLHKYGYTSRGASLILLCDRGLADYQRFSFKDWPTGEFITTTLAGSRPGGAIASAWAVMNYLGLGGYRERVEKIVGVRSRLEAEIAEIEGVRVLGEPKAGIIGIGGSGSTDMRSVKQGMLDRGWKFAPLVEPVGMNLLLNFTHGSVVDRFLNDLKASIDDAEVGRASTIEADESYGG